jgi:hypothetical protein
VFSTVAHSVGASPVPCDRQQGTGSTPDLQCAYHVSGGAARDITFEFSGSIEDSSGFVISELRYLKEGIPFLGPGETIRCLWDHFDRLILYLEEKGHHEGIAVQVSYKDLPGEAYVTEWRINPLLYKGLRYDASQLPQVTLSSQPDKIPADATIDRTGEVGNRDTDQET